MAKNHSFSDCGIAGASVLTEEADLMDEWLNRGYSASMTYLERNGDKRREPQILLPHCKSVIALSLNYFTDHHHTKIPSKGKLSRYSWGDDYHDVLGEKLDAFIGELKKKFPDEEFKRYVDTGPVMEKAWAVRAGLGWQGKHSNVISRDRGSWFFLGVVFTTLELLPDQPIRDYCGSCTACITACPTSAIVEPYVVDGRKCISYWTIETKPEQEFPPEIKSSLDGWLFGCDACQDVCPWNRFEVESSEPRFQPRSGEVDLELKIVGEITQEEFSERFKKSPVKRAKLGGLKRNAKELQS